MPSQLPAARSETYKFHERVQLDSITQNELGDPEAVAHVRIT